MFINRINELEKLNEEYHKKGSSFSIVYGRRRVGKTALISEFIKDKPHIYLYITEGDLNSQLETFLEEIKAFVDESLRDFINFDSFERAIEFVSTLKLERKLVLVIDEYQNLILKDRAFSSKLQQIWDLKLQKSNIHLILCGSVVSMMYSETLNYNSPLYGRRTSSFHIKPLKFKHIKEFLPNLSKLEQIQVFSSFGTIPKYLLEYDESLTFMQNVEKKILDKNSYLYSEGTFLLKDEIAEPASFFSIMKVVAEGNSKVGNIASRLGVTSSYLSKYLLKLIDLDFLEKEVPITEKNPQKSKLGRYRIKDNFLKFWFFYVYRNYSYLEIGNTQYVLKEIEKNFNDRFVSFAFEEYVKEEILENPKKYLGFVPLKIGRWWSNREEIDLVAFDEENIAFIECKWQNRVDKEAVKNALIQKSKQLIGDKKATYLVFGKEDYLQELFS